MRKAIEIGSTELPEQISWPAFIMAAEQKEAWRSWAEEPITELSVKALAYCPPQTKPEYPSLYAMFKGVIIP